MKRIKNLFYKITNIGVYPEITYIEKIRVQLANQSQMVVIVASLITLALKIVDQKNGFGFFGFFILTSIFSFVLNYFHKYFLSRLLLTFGFPLILFACHILFGNDSGVLFTYLGFVAGILICYDSWILTQANIIYVLSLMIGGIYYCENYKVIYFEETDTRNLIIMAGATVLVLTIGIKRFIDDIRKQQYLVEKNNAELEKQNKHLEYLVAENHRKTELLGIIAHDIRGTALSFRGLTKKINYLAERKEQERLIALLESIEAKEKKLFYNLENLLSWVVAQKNSLEVNYSEFNLKKVVDDLSENILLQNKEKQIQIKNGVNEFVYLILDENILKIILYNLILNAIKYSSTTGSISINFNRNQKNIELLVVDNGEGMPQEILQEIQAGKFNNKITKNGYGLGLSICHSLTTTLGGKMMVESKVHQGTQIALTFPVLDKKTSSKIEQNCLRASGMSSEPVVFFPINLKENTTAS